MNQYKCTITGKSYSEATIKANLSQAYRQHYLFEPSGSCEGCMAKAVCTAHIIPKARCKVLHLTSLIWSPENWFRSCYRCNSTAENIASLEILKLHNIDRIIEVIERYDPERFRKFP